MTEETNVEKSLEEQIMDAIFVSIDSKDEFDADTVSKLRQLAENGSFGKSALVAEAIAEK